VAWQASRATRSKAPAGARRQCRQQAKSNEKLKFNPTKESKIMTHDPFQTYPNLGSYYGVQSPLGLQYPTLQTSAINPLAALSAILGLSPMAQIAGIPQVGPSPYGVNPFQSFVNPQMQQAQSPYGVNPFQSPINPQQMQQGQPPYGMNGFQSPINPQQMQLASLLASPLILQNPLLAASVLSNPLIAASLHSSAPGSYGVPQFGLQSPSLYPQLGQAGSPFGHPLAPQSWIGQGGLPGGIQGFGPLHSLQSQMIPRPFQAQGLSPWGY
jgi:hypothetical protein